MRTEIRNRPDYASLHVLLDSGESVITESGAMMGMDPALKMETNMQGGLFGAAKRMMGGESVFLNTYTASGDGQRLDIAPSSPGDMAEVPLDGTLLIQRGGYCACTPGIELSAKWGGAKSFFAGEGLVMLSAVGQGTVWIASYGAIEQIEIQDTYIVDTSHIVAFDSTLDYTLRKVGGMKSLFLSSEGIVCEFRGQGRLWIQTRNAPALASFLNPFRRVQKKN